MYAETVCTMGTYDAVKTQLAEYWAMLDLGRCDAQGLRDVMPTAMLRVYEDHECYAFIKRYCIAEVDDKQQSHVYRNIQYPNMTIPADPFEHGIIDLVQRFIEHPHISSLPHVSAIIILKTRMVLDLKALEASANLAPFKKLPTEIVDTIRSFIPYSSIIANNRALLEQRDYSKEIAELEAQLSKLYHFAKKLKPHYWPLLFNPKTELPKTPVYLDHGTLAEAHLVLTYSGISWLESPGVIDFVKAKVASGEWH